MKWRLAVAIAFMVGAIFQLFAGDTIIGIVWMVVAAMWFGLAYSRYKFNQRVDEMLTRMQEYKERWEQ